MSQAFYYLVISDLEDGALRAWLRSSLSEAIVVYCNQIRIDMINTESDGDEIEPFQPWRGGVPSPSLITAYLRDDDVLAAYSVAKDWYDNIITQGDGRCSIAKVPILGGGVEI